MIKTTTLFCLLACLPAAAQISSSPAPSDARNSGWVVLQGSASVKDSFDGMPVFARGTYLSQGVLFCQTIPSEENSFKDVRILLTDPTGSSGYQARWSALMRVSLDGNYSEEDGRCARLEQGEIALKDSNGDIHTFNAETSLATNLFTLALDRNGVAVPEGSVEYGGEKGRPTLTVAATATVQDAAVSLTDYVGTAAIDPGGAITVTVKLRPVAPARP